MKKTGLLKSISKYGLIPAVALGNLLTRGIEKVTGKKYGTTGLEEASQTKFGRALGVATAGVALAAGAAYNPAVAKVLIPKSVVGKTIGLATIGAASVSPTLTSAALEAPIKIFETGQKIGEVIESTPEIAESGAGKNILLALGASALITGGVATAIAAGKNYLDSKEEELVPLEAPTFPKSEIEEATISPAAPVEEEAVSSVSKPRKRRKTRREPLQQKISQRVDVRVGVNAANRKYIKNEVYSN